MPFSVYDFLVALEDEKSQSQPAKPNTQADGIDVREFILSTPDVRGPLDAQAVKDFIVEYEFPVPVAELEFVLGDRLEAEGFSEVQVVCHQEPGRVELSMTAPGPLTIRAAMKQMRVLAQAFGYSIPDGRVVAVVRDLQVTAAFSIEPAV